MTFLISNYSSNLSTEAFYFDKCLKEVGDTKSFLWSDRRISTFDMFDSVNPDIFITHFGMVTKDILKYLSQHRNISLVMNVSDADQDSIVTIENVLDDAQINCPLFFSNVAKELQDINPKRRLVRITPGVDIFLPIGSPPSFSVDTCYISQSKSELSDTVINSDNKESYHTIYTNSNNNEGDMNLNINDLVSFFGSYDVCNLVGNAKFVTSQIFYEASVRSKAIKLRTGEDQEIVNKIISRMFREEKGKKIGEIVRDQILENYNCFSKTAELIKEIGDSNLANKIEKFHKENILNKKINN